MATVTIRNDFGAQENKICHCFHFFPIYFKPSTSPTLDPIGFITLKQLFISLPPPSPFAFFPSIRVFSNESAPVLPVNIQGWYSSGLTGLIFLLSKGLSRIFSSTTVQKHQFFGAQPSLWSHSHIHTWLVEKHSFDYMCLNQQSDVSAFWYTV